MKYVLISDLRNAEEFDDALYGVKTRIAPDPEKAEETETIEIFSANDLFRIKKRLPEGADALALKDDWMFWNSSTNEFLGYVFRD